MDYAKLEDKDILEWARLAIGRGGSFVCAMGHAAMQADQSNFRLIRPTMLQLIAKYPKYLEWAREDAAKDAVPK